MALGRDELIRLEALRAAATTAPTSFFEPATITIQRAREFEDYIRQPDDEYQDPLFTGDGPEHKPEEEEPQL